MAQEFVHLHLHSDYSMLDGACKIGKLAELATRFEMPAMAVTDHGNMCGAFETYSTFTKHGVKPLIGCEFYLAPGTRFDKSPDHPHHKGYHLLLLARDAGGYQNLCRLNAVANREGYYFKPRIDKEVLAANAGGLLGATACLGGEVPALLLNNQFEKAREAVDQYAQILGRENFFLELQDHGMEEQHKVNRGLLQLSRETGLPVIATNDAHYLTRDHAAAHDVLLCIGTQKNLTDTARMRFSSQEFYVKSPAEMARLFAEVPEALTNTLAVAERCNLEFDLEANHYPVFEPEDGSDRVEFLRRLCIGALGGRYGFEYGGDLGALDARQRAVIERMDYEIEVIERMGFTSYFLVVWDFLDYARQQGIPIGPGRGSGAGSIVAYLLHITDIDPLRYQLLFERFLNPDRVSPPDFDIDLCERRRGEVIEYVRRKYGDECVAQIGTFGTLKAKAVIKDVARVVGRSFDEGNRLTKLIPGEPKMTLAKALKESSELQQLHGQEEWVREIFSYAEPLEGLNRNMSIHAAGVIIGDQPLSNLVPLARGQGDEVITQYPAKPCEALGLLKMDFLGLRTLTIIQDTCDLIAKARGLTLKPAEIPMDDPKAYELLNKGQTVCVFQLESGGMQDLCRRFGVSRIEDIIALIALYRPGPMQFLDEFISRKSGQTKVEYDTELIRPILEETCGIMLYQEQVMQVVQKAAGFSLGHADIMRRAMGKKDKEAMLKMCDQFVAGCKQNGLSEAVARGIWQKIVMFAGYGFNKSHSAAYAFLAYRTAYLKANYPVEFMAANLSSEMGSADRVSVLIRECREMGIPVLPPAVNVSDLTFTVDEGSIRFGLAAIRGVGNAAANAILEARREGPFDTLLDFCERMGSAANRRLLECLCQCGAFDSLGLRRAQVFAIVDDAIGRAQAAIRDREAGQSNFFDLLHMGNGATASDIVPPDIPEWESGELLQYEKELLGFYVTGHPLDEYVEALDLYRVGTLLGVREWPDNRGVRVGGIIAGLSTKFARKDGRPWAIIRLEDMDSSIECLVYADVYAEHQPAITAEAPVFLEGYVTRKEAEDVTKITATKVIPMAEAVEQLTEELHLRIYQERTAPGLLDRLRDLIRQYPGSVPVILCVVCDSRQVAFVEAGAEFGVSLCPELKSAVTELLGEDSYHLKPNLDMPDRQPRSWERRNTTVSA